MNTPSLRRALAAPALSAFVLALAALALTALAPSAHAQGSNAAASAAQAGGNPQPADAATAARIRKGPAPKNLHVPEYEFTSDTVVKIG